MLSFPDLHLPDINSGLHGMFEVYQTTAIQQANVNACINLVSCLHRHLFFLDDVHGDFLCLCHACPFVVW